MSKPDVASQMRVALSNKAPNTGSNSPADELITLRTSDVAESCFKASSRSRVRRASSISWPTDASALRRFGVTALWGCGLARSPPALERRLIAFPKAQDKAL
jgi:hypothetical protein